MEGRESFGAKKGGRGASAAGKDGQRRPMFRRRKVCKFCADKIDDINYKDTQAADAVRARARQDPAAADLGHLRAAPAKAADGAHARAAAGAHPVHVGVGEGVMEVILREHVDNLGKRGEVVKVADGYARNYLLPRKLALLATDGNKRHVERERKIVEAREADETGAGAGDRGASRSSIEIAIARRVGDTEQLYGSVTSADIADFLKGKGFEIDRRKLILPEPIKTIGEHTVPLQAAPRRHGVAEGAGGQGRRDLVEEDARLGSPAGSEPGHQGIRHASASARGFRAGIIKAQGQRHKAEEDPARGRGRAQPPGPLFSRSADIGPCRPFVPASRIRSVEA